MAAFLSEAVRGEWWQASGLDRKTERERTVSQSDQPEACCDHVFELMWRRLLLLCSCLQEIKLDYSWQPYKMYRDSGPHHQTVVPSNLIWKCLFSHFNTKESISSSLSELLDQSDWSLQITGSDFTEASLRLVTMWSLYRPEPLLKSRNHSRCLAESSDWLSCDDLTAGKIFKSHRDSVALNFSNSSHVSTVNPSVNWWVNVSVSAVMMCSWLSALYFLCVLEWNLQSKQTW